MRDYYQILGVSHDARPDEIRQAYRRLAREHLAADSQVAAQQFDEIRRAYEILSDARRRHSYDRRRAVGPTAPSEEVRTCWTDEVALDFPSTALVLERMRRDFFGGRDADLPAVLAEVSLSSQQANRGARVPLDISVRCTCPVCAGRGEIWAERCALCRGTGAGAWLHQIRVSVPAGVSAGDRLRLHVQPPYAPATSVEVRIAIH